MAALPQYSYIFGLGICFAFLDAWSIGANDVANSFATSVSSRSLTMTKAMTSGGIMEFVGAVLAGSRVVGTIRNDIISIEAFEQDPSVLMMGMLCALIGSSLFLTLATKIGLPVSTTHCIIGGIIGVGFATVGANGVDWSWGGVSQVFAAWGIAPCIAGCFGAMIFTFTMSGVFKSKNPLRMGIITVPIYFALTSGICTMLIVWKGAASLDLDDWGVAPTVGTIFGVADGCALLSVIFLLPFVYVRLVKEDWQVKQWDILKGPLLLRRRAPPPMPAGHRLVSDYYAGHKTREELERDGADRESTGDEESIGKDGVAPAAALALEETSASAVAQPSVTSDQMAKAERQLNIRKWYEPQMLWKKFVWLFFRGVMVDVVVEQSHSNEAKGLQRLLAGTSLADKHARVEHYNPKVEHLYSFLQVLTAATASFAHGANDVAIAMGPLSAIYHIWNTGTTGEDSAVPIWVLVFGGASISIGLWTYGYNLMRNLGNRITLHSHCRGFPMELGAALTVVLATRLALPVLTTQCIIGATVGVGLCAGDVKAINWRMVIWAYAGWFITLPCTAVFAGCLMGSKINSPQFGNSVQRLGISYVIAIACHWHVDT
ncbi:Phosphate-repressible phosphate permease pho-4 [Fulvia fulva]|nr:Phosphate-repressible phosphate permease pho-4 [Fulvia fulva]WPV27907.1 Phosphate-repressible phosphate permease pho-4 [Fulvia fulva]